jgi:hypothetical protein
MQFFQESLGERKEILPRLMVAVNCFVGDSGSYTFCQVTRCSILVTFPGAISNFGDAPPGHGILA